MMHIKLLKTASICVLTIGCISTSLYADSFGSGSDAFTIDFVDIGNAGNADDEGAGGGIFSSPYGGVGYSFRMGVLEISQEQITKATASGLANVTAGAWAGSMPAAGISWYEAAAYVNWLNTSTGHQAAYNLSFSGGWSMSLWNSGSAWQLDGENLFRHKDAYYFLPSEDEWYKAAYHQNDGVTANYFDFAVGRNLDPGRVASGTDFGTAVFASVSATPADVDSNGGLSAYGTRGQNGNVWEWLESAHNDPNDDPTEDRGLRGGSWTSPEASLRSSSRNNAGLAIDGNLSNDFGFRVASIPEPSIAILGLAGLSALFSRRVRNERNG